MKSEFENSGVKCARCNRDLLISKRSGKFKHDDKPCHKKD